MYVLPNGISIDEDGLFEAFVDDSKNHTYYFDSTTGDIGCLDINDGTKKIDLDPTRYFIIPSIPIIKKVVWLQEFIDAIVTMEDKALAGKLGDLAQNITGYDTALQIIKDHPDGWIHGWVQWQSDSVYAEIEEWIDTLPIEITEDWGLDCDCELCKLMQKGDHTVGDFREAAAKQEQKQKEKNAGRTKIFNKDDLYYEAMELINDGNFKKAEVLLLQALALDTDYVQTYVGLVSVYGSTKQKKKAHKMIDMAFAMTQKVFPKWPQELEWGWLENRAYLRAIQYKAEKDEEEGNTESAIELYRLLLKLNPNDNQGVRYVLAGIYAGISGNQINDMMDEGNRKQHWGPLYTLVETQNKKHRFWKKPKL